MTCLHWRADFAECSVGFVGAWICTILFGFVLTNILMRYKYFICPVNDLGANVFTGLECDVNPVFIARTYRLPFIPSTYTFLPTTITVASRLKRPFNIKDFGDAIPGHGGMTDRMDCQFIMGFFAFMYYQSFIAVYKASVGSVIETAIIGLNTEQQIEVVKGLAKYLYNQGAIDSKVPEFLNANLVSLLAKR